MGAKDEKQRSVGELVHQALGKGIALDALAKRLDEIEERTQRADRWAHPPKKPGGKK